jgi:UDP-glucuronate decarboxylase
VAERVLITGGAGFVGCHLARNLVAAGARVTLLDDFSRGRRDAELEALLPRVELREWDLTRPLPDDLPPPGCTQVFHLAARVGVRQSEQQPEQVLRTNLLSTINLLDACARRPGLAIGFASSSEVYAGSVAAGQAPVPTPETVPLTVQVPPAARASYGVSKIAGELLCTWYGWAYGLRMRIFRLHNVYGPRMGRAHVIPQFALRALGGADPFAVFGDQVRCFCHVDDAVGAILRIMQLDDPEPLVVNVGNDREEIAMSDLARRVTALAGYEPTLAVQPPPPGSPDRRRPDLTRLRSLIAYEPAVDLDRGLAQTFRWYQENG